MTFQEGQEVEVFYLPEYESLHQWRKATIVGREFKHDEEGGGPSFSNGYVVQFLDGTCGVVDEEHIRYAKI
jgi:hypothetical protein